MSLSEMIFMKAMMPELGTSQPTSRGQCGWQPDKTPMLMAAKAPNFSRLLIATFHTIFHGRMASTMSMMPE